MHLYCIDKSPTLKKIQPRLIKAQAALIQPQFLQFFATVLSLRLRPRSFGEVDKAFRFAEADSKLVFFPTDAFMLFDPSMAYSCLKTTVDMFCEPATNETVLIRDCWTRLNVMTMDDNITKVEGKILRTLARRGIHPLESKPAEPIPPSVDPLVELADKCNTFCKLLQELDDKPERYAEHLKFSYDDGGLPENPQIWAMSDRGIHFIQSFKSVDPMERFGLNEHVLLPEAEQGFQPGQELQPLFSPVDMCQFDLDQDLPEYNQEDSSNSRKREREEEEEEDEEAELSPNLVKREREEPRVVLNLVSEEEEEEEDSLNSRKRERDEEEDIMILPGATDGSAITYKRVAILSTDKHIFVADRRFPNQHLVYEVQCRTQWTMEIESIVVTRCTMEIESTVVTRATKELVYYEQFVKPVHGFTTVRQLTPTEGEIIFQFL